MSEPVPDVYPSGFVHPSTLDGWESHVPSVATPEHLTAPAAAPDPDPAAAPAVEGEHHGE